MLEQLRSVPSWLGTRDQTVPRPHSLSSGLGSGKAYDRPDKYHMSCTCYRNKTSVFAIH